MNDLYNPSGTTRSIDYLTEKFEKSIQYYKEKNKDQLDPKELELNPFKLPKNTILKALNATFMYEFWGAAVAKILGDVATTCNPILIRRLIASTMASDTASTNRGIGYAIGISFLLLLTNFLTNIHFYNAMMTGAQARSTLINAIYKKNLRLSPKSRLNFPNGKITNIMSIDTHRVDFSTNFFHFSWTFPISVGISIAVVLTNIGASGLVGFAVFFVSFFVVIFTGKHLSHLRSKTHKVTDERVSLMREVLNAVKNIKFYSWERAYAERIRNIRKRELKLVFSVLGWRNFLNALVQSIPVFAGLFAFITLSKTGGSLNPATVFSSLSVFNVMRIPFILLPLSIITSIDAYQSLKRIEAFMSAEELENYIEYVEDSEYAIKITDGGFMWEEADVVPVKEKKSKNSKKSKKNDKDSKMEEKQVENSTKELTDGENEKDLSEVSSSEEHKIFPGLFDTNFAIRKGEFIIITGPIGSGKSSLLSAMAGSMHKVSGRVEISGSTLPAGQPWVQNATVRDNIIFGRPYDEAWYNQVITSCSLSRDLQILPAGDMTEVGERGITLSGGQKARISLARAVYNNRDNILLDDVLSAVDAHVGKEIMDNCLLGLLKHKTRVLATHQLAMIEYADRVIFVDGTGKSCIGTEEELRATVPAFDNLMRFNGNSEDEDSTLKTPDEEEDLMLAIKKSKTTKGSENKNTATGALMSKEDQESDGINIEVYKNFVRHGSLGMGWFLIPVFLLLILISNFSQVFTSIWLSFWTSNRFKGREEGFYIGIFVLLTFCTAIFIFLYSITMTSVGNKTSERLHNLATDSVLHAPMSFFDSSPLGRILNRFTHDINTIDNELSEQVRLFVYSLSLSIATYIMVMCYIPWFLIAFFVLGFLFVQISSFYRSSAREAKRLDSVARSKVFAHFGESLAGANVIQNYNDEDKFIDTMQTQLNVMNSAYFFNLASQRWLTVRLDGIGFISTIITTLLCVTKQFNINPSSVGLIVSGILQIMPMMSMIVREMALAENNMNAVERLHHYAYNLPQEAQYDKPETAPPASWPDSGRIEFDHVTMAYRPELDPALKDLTIQVEGSQKIGICGRTGAGKSTIMTAIYRLVELKSGKIFIDGIDISTLGLHQLRSKLSIIPQDSILFRGTIRSNIDPFGTYSDEQLWDALRRAWLVTQAELNRVLELEARGISTLELLKNGDASMPKFHLDRSVDDEGTNFSLGERQLLALATALVRDSKVLILDEATSNVDFQTDSRIQSTIVSEFKDCTILCIAHRLRTILNYDKILVMDQGEVAEFDTPLNLYQKGGIFRSMCDDSSITLENFTATD